MTTTKATPKSPNATYLYCLVQSKTAPPFVAVPPGLAGMKPPRAIAAGPSMWLIGADAPLARYSPERIEAALPDLDWVTECAVAHERVIEHFPGAVPMKLFTLFTSDARAKAYIAANRKTLLATLRRIAGCQEWGVRIRFQGGATAGTQARPVASGTAFLRSKKEARDQALEQAESALEDAQIAYRALSRHAKQAALLRIVKEDAESRVILNAAFLVPIDRTKPFRAAAEDSTKRLTESCVVTISGPWPPYNFLDGKK